MKKIILLLTSVLFTISSYAQSEYKIGVHFFKTQKATSTQAQTEKNLDDMIASITANHPNRTINGKKVKFVVGLEIPWSLTEPSPGIYDFEWYKNFAKLCEERGISWTPLLSPHYIPKYIYDDPNSKYANHKITTIDGKPTESSFLPYSPSSPIWDNEVADWIKAFVNAMVDSNHITISPWNRKAIDEILVGNEMIYPFNIETSSDEATKAAWVKYGNDINSYPTTDKDFRDNWNTFASNKPNQLRDFRNKELAYCITGMMHVTKSQLALRLGSYRASKIGVSSKLVPYMFPRENIAQGDEYCGYDNSEIGYLIQESNNFLAIDLYTAPYSSDFSAASDRLKASGKSIYLAEFNRAPKDHTDPSTHVPLTTSEIYNYGKSGFDHHNLKYYVYFAWNPDGGDSYYKINDAQKLGLYNLFNELAPITNPIEPGYQNNFASGAYTIPANYNDNKNFTLSFGDVDWYKFNVNGKAHYLKVTQKNKTSITTPKKYGLKLITSFNEITAETYSVFDGEIDTEIRLYNQNLIELAYNDNKHNFSKFSKLNYNRFNLPPILFPKESNLKQFEVSILPNPAINYINISYKRLNSIYNLSIKDVNNKTVFKENQIKNIDKKIDVSSFKKGLYFVTIQTNNNQIVIKKIVKK